MKTKQLQTLWWDWLSTTERLLSALHEQTVAVTLRDVARVERLQPEIESLLERVRSVDDQAVNCAKRLAESLGTKPDFRSLVQSLDTAESQQVQALANRVTVVARNVQAVIEKNQKLIENEMTYINGTLTLIAKAAVTSGGPYAAGTSTSVLVNQAA